MSVATPFRKTIFISFLGHMALFSIFSFSFGSRIPKLNHANVSFLGSVLRSQDLAKGYFGSKPPVKAIFNLPEKGLPIGKTGRDYSEAFRQYYKPLVSAPFNQDKIIPTKSMLPVSFSMDIKKPVVMLYPHLPYHFLIYFKDRQSVHMELLFNLASQENPGSIMIKRKISSGNLEVDLLAMRYIGHYLFIQQGHILPDNWQTVKIDLSAKND